MTTTDHKKIGIMYITTAYIFFLLAGLMALGIRTELAFPGTQLLEPDLYNQAFTMHGTTMIFFFVMPMLAGFANYIVPLQIGAADMAFPRINALSFWIIPFCGVLLFSGFLMGGAANAGWTSYTPLSDADVLDDQRPGPLAGGAHPERRQLDHGRHQLPGHDLPPAGAGHDACCGCRSSPGPCS